MKCKMKNVKKIIAKYDDIFFLILFYLLIIGRVLYIKTDVGDELWNFQNIYKMYNGYKIYVDANVIVTPLFHFIGFIFFRVFGANFFVFRIYYSIICLFLFFGIYKIFKSLNVGKKFSFLFTSIIFLLNIIILQSTPNYNTVAITIVLYAILIIIKRKEIHHYCFFESILIFLIFLSKQNIGVLYLFAYIIYSLYSKDIKNLFKILLYIILYSSIFILILYKLNILCGFINYCILGLKDFAKNNYSIHIWSTIYMFIISLINALILNWIFFCKNDELKKENKENLLIIMPFSFSVLFITYPILNIHHESIALILQYIQLCYILSLFLKNKKKLILFLIIYFLIFINLIRSVFYCYLYFNNIENEKSNVYYGSLLEEELKQKMQKVIKYINSSNKRIIILSSDAALYMIPLKLNNGVLDMVLIGNLGKDGEEKIISQLKNMENYIVLLNKEKKSYQESDKIRKYIESYWINTGVIEDMNIYEKLNK